MGILDEMQAEEPAAPPPSDQSPTWSDWETQIEQQIERLTGTVASLSATVRDVAQHQKLNTSTTAKVLTEIEELRRAPAPTTPSSASPSSDSGSSGESSNASVMRELGEIGKTLTAMTELLSSTEQPQPNSSAQTSASVAPELRAAIEDNRRAMASVTNRLERVVEAVNGSLRRDNERRRAARREPRHVAVYVGAVVTLMFAVMGGWSAVGQLSALWAWLWGATGFAQAGHVLALAVFAVSAGLGVYGLAAGIRAATPTTKDHWQKLRERVRRKQ